LPVDALSVRLDLEVPYIPLALGITKLEARLKTLPFIKEVNFHLVEVDGVTTNKAVGWVEVDDPAEGMEVDEEDSKDWVQVVRRREDSYTHGTLFELAVSGTRVCLERRTLCGVCSSGAHSKDGCEILQRLTSLVMPSLALRTQELTERPTNGTDKGKLKAQVVEEGVKVIDEVVPSVTATTTTTKKVKSASRKPKRG
jgi:hypothetical protein